VLEIVKREANKMGEFQIYSLSRMKDCIFF
jgi:hypothetical protein